MDGFTYENTAGEKAFREWASNAPHLAHRESFMAGRASVAAYPRDAAEERKITPWTRAYGAPGDMFRGVIEAIDRHEQAMLYRPATIAMSTSTRRALVREFFPNHEPGDWQKGDLVAGLPIVINDGLQFGHFLTSGKER